MLQKLLIEVIGLQSAVFFMFGGSLSIFVF